MLAGDEDAWRELYERAYNRTRAYIVWRCAGRTDWTDDVLQETWMIAVRRIRKFDPDVGSFVDWLRGIAANVLRNRIRGTNGQVTGTGSRLEPADDRRPEQPLEQRERAAAIAQALATLPPHYEDVLRAKYVDRRSVIEIAAAGGQSAKAVESLLGRARDAFRKSYARTTGESHEPS
ncbi:MAG: sigma-70 family RNA polymerase sigma factor [Planctomycetes bacterium]|nr:sigma-70 family RNA polymerase sigma factor [Planctomycetota bacterium]